MKYLLDGQSTNRLSFRLLEPTDFDIWVNLFKAQNVTRFLGLDPSLKPEELCQSWFNKIFYRYQHDLGGHNVLIDKATNQFIGQCGLLVQEVEGIERLEIGYSILPEFWNKGYATEAARKCRDFAFENNFWDSLISIVHLENIGSEKVARKNGMTFEKTVDSYRHIPVNIFRIDRQDWQDNYYTKSGNTP